MRTVLRSWITSWTDFFEESTKIPEDDDYEEPQEEGETDWLKVWALCIRCGISDNEWGNMTFVKIHALSKANQLEQELRLAMHGCKVEKRPRKAKKLSDLGISLPG
jgi:hypothetical protein